MITTQHPTWMDDAACASVGPELFFPDQGLNRQTYAEPLRVCAACPVQAPCLEMALANDERHGVWGGTTPTERKNMKRANRRELERMIEARDMLREWRIAKAAGQTSDEVAERLGTNGPAYRRRLVRAKATLRRAAA